MINNKEFLTALFGDSCDWVHVTDFPFDPFAIPKDETRRAWKGDYFCRYQFGNQTNQYFTISNFYAEDGQAKRKKTLYWQTPVIVLDDVKEKLNMTEVSKLPSPSWILETSPGSEQWGYILDTPCTDRHRAENLLDGLVANGLAPNGKDPGMKGVTRYVRLPEGYNLKKSKMIDGKPFKCQITLWQPFNRVTLEELANPFNVNLDAQRREGRLDGAAEHADHPLINIPDLIRIKEVRSAGRFDIVCPWVEEHTGADDSGSAVFTNEDGTIGFKCHHGACEGRTGKDLLAFIEEEKPGFGEHLQAWQFQNDFKEFQLTAQPASTPVQTPVIQPPPSVQAAPEKPVEQNIPSPGEMLRTLVGELRRIPPGSNDSIKMCEKILKNAESLGAMDKVYVHEEVCDVMRWSKKDFGIIIKDLRKEWYDKGVNEADFFSDVVYVADIDQFFDRKRRIFYRPEAYQNAYAHLDAEARKTALQGGRVMKVHKIDYAPKMPDIFDINGTRFANSWCDHDMPAGVPGDVTTWLNHWDAVGWTQHRDHMLKWMAWTILHPDVKINHMLILGGREGVGKDFLLYPLIKAMGDHAKTIDGDELLEPYNNYILSTKFLNINEVELGTRSEAVAISAKLKPLAAAPPYKLRFKEKFVKAVEVRNLISVAMTTNSRIPVRIDEISRRMYAIWTDLCIRDHFDDVLPEWIDYWTKAWYWMNEQGGVEACIHYLRNCVDLSDFNPAAAPPVTEFLREIRESSKSPAHQTIEKFIENKIGCFAWDMFSVEDTVDTFNPEAMSQFSDINPNRKFMYCDHKILKPHIVNTILSNDNYKYRKVAIDGKQKKVFVINNIQQNMTLSEEMFVQKYLNYQNPVSTAPASNLVTFNLTK